MTASGVAANRHGHDESSNRAISSREAASNGAGLKALAGPR